MWGRFEERGLLGRGAYGSVYRVLDRERGAVVALKVLDHAEPDALYRFKREFRLVADRGHPNLVQLHELLSDGEVACFTMELVEGTSFTTFVRAAAPDGREAILGRALAGLTEGLGALHDLGILHRDVKPSNVLVTPQGRVVLLDFGLAAERVGEDSPGELVGSPPYMAPELLYGEGASEASDWYAVGVMLHEAIAGTLPFAPNDRDREEAPRLGAIAPGTPPELEELVASLLDPVVARRAGDARVRAFLGLPGGAPRIPFVGRAAELAALDAAWADARAGGAVAIEVRGPSGIGKTALLDELVRRVTRDPRAVVLRGRCFEQESVPYKGLDAVIDGLGRKLGATPAIECDALLPANAAEAARLFPTLRQAGLEPPPADGVDAIELRRRAVAALRGIVGAVARHWPLAVIIDDVQWSDVDSARLLEELLGGPDAPPMLTLLSHRGPGPTAMLPRQATPRVVTLGPLAPPDAEALALAHLGERGARLDAALREGEGDPFLLGVYCAGDAAERELTLTGVMARRLAGLSAQARRLLEVIAVAAHPLGRQTAGAAAALSDAWHPNLGVLRAASLVRVAADGTGDVEAYHDRIRAAVVAGLPDAVRAAHHRALATTLDAAGTVDPERIAEHLAAGGLADQAAERFLVAAERAERSLAFHRAAELYGRARERGTARLSPLELLLRQADALSSAGRGRDAAAAYLEAAPSLPADEALAARRKAAEQLLRVGRMDEGLTLAGQALEAVGLALPASPRRALASIAAQLVLLRLRGLDFEERTVAEAPPEILRRIDTCWSVSAGLTAIDSMRAAALQLTCLRLALDAGEPTRVLRSYAAHAAFTANRGAPAWPRVSALLGRARALVARTGDPYGAALTTGVEGIARFHLGEWRRGRALLEDAERSFRERCAGAVKETATMALFVLSALTLEGDLAEVRRRLPSYLRDAEARGDLYTEVHLQSGIINLAHLGADDPRGARDHAARGLAEWSMEDNHFQHFFGVLAETHIDLYAGDAGAARERLAAHRRRLERSLLLRTQWIRIQWTWLSARVALASGADDHRTVRDAARRLRAERRPWADPMASALDGALARARGDVAAAERAFLAAAAGFASAEMSLLAGVARRAAAELRSAPLSAVDADLTALGVARPERMARVFDPSRP